MLSINSMPPSCGELLPRSVATAGTLMIMQCCHQHNASEQYDNPENNFRYRFFDFDKEYREISALAVPSRVSRLFRKFEKRRLMAPICESARRGESGMAHARFLRDEVLHLLEAKAA